MESRGSVKRFSLMGLVFFTTFLGSRPAVQQSLPQLSKRCRENPDLVGRCFTVHGALRFYNGGIPFKIWTIGTTRMLGVGAPYPARAEYCQLPQSLQDQVSPDAEVIADFV